MNYTSDKAATARPAACSPAAVPERKKHAGDLVAPFLSDAVLASLEGGKPWFLFMRVF
jgi:hypothetical protein